MPQPVPSSCPVLFFPFHKGIQRRTVAKTISTPLTSTTSRSKDAWINDNLRCPPNDYQKVTIERVESNSARNARNQMHLSVSVPFCSYDSAFPRAFNNWNIRFARIDGRHVEGKDERLLPTVRVVPWPRFHGISLRVRTNK